ncbi:MAG: GyrI-like domain-containing protein [Planctomycetes bacterium]|nr:GyrI-like domain-containing protein [Planctomycetota bacterium]
MVVTAPAATIVYLRHTGAYWAIGPAVNEVTEMMQEVGSNGPLLIRYNSNPRNTPPDRLELDIGFFVADPPRVESPFEIEFLDSRQAVSLKTSAPPRANVGQIQFLHEWIEQHSLEESGPTFEIWALDMNPQGATISQSELQIPVTACSTPVLGYDSPMVRPSANSIAGRISNKTGAAKSERDMESHRIRAEESPVIHREREESGPRAPVVSSNNETSAVVERNSHSGLGRPANEPRPLAPFPGNITDPEEMRKIIEQAWANRWKLDSDSPREAERSSAFAPAFGNPTNPQGANSTISSKTKSQNAPEVEKPNEGASARLAESTSKRLGDPSTITISHLLDTENYTSLAERIVPEAKRIHPSLQIWLGQVVFRVSAVANGMRKNYQGQADELSVFAEKLKNRYREVSKDFNLDAADRDPGFELGSQIADRKAQVMRNLDRLMGKIGMKTTDSDAARIELTVILNSTSGVLKDGESAGEKKIH